MPLDMTGQKCGRLTVTDTFEVRGRRRTYWLCACSCGAQKWVIADALRSGATRSCGCLNDETRRETRHGGAVNGRHSPEYATWHSMKQRCTNPRNSKFERYGGRGIGVCDRWLNFDAFLADMGPRPSLSHSIDRIDNDRGYEPGNCRWALIETQNRNHSRNHLITYKGESLCLADWVTRTGIPHATLSWRLRNWPLDKALTTPVAGRLRPYDQ